MAIDRVIFHFLHEIKTLHKMECLSFVRIKTGDKFINNILHTCRAETFFKLETSVALMKAS